MIPKIIHCVWLSGDDKPVLYLNCLKSWQEKMPDYEIKEWSLDKFPNEVTEHPFVKGALESRKWAYATDYIRLWLLYNYGGIYMDLDVMVFKSFNPFLEHGFFTSIELNPIVLYKTLKSKEILGIGLEAAVMGCIPHHPFISDALGCYSDLKFINTPEFCFQYIMPRVLTRIAINNYGFKQVPCMQVLKEGMWIYPCDVFSSVYNWSNYLSIRLEDAINILNKDVIRYSVHICAHGWFEGKENQNSLKWKIKHIAYRLLFAKYWKKNVSFHKSPV